MRILTSSLTLPTLSLTIFLKHAMFKSRNFGIIELITIESDDELEKVVSTKKGKEKTKNKSLVSLLRWKWSQIAIHNCYTDIFLHFNLPCTNYYCSWFYSKIFYEINHVLYWTHELWWGLQCSRLQFFSSMWRF